ncbi:sulfate ABC transporter substrate-binding protein [Calothrix sp. PCC 7507]|uniref:sulfate ABC transporter substrate-binding protein n=1 Tax=Calothrix sp. PCC 7507 TaxID=99598 RepID=UPI00029EC3FD|nr:sulfate ABC transporter substrate-binding protein [Calothrix sp. PCC 7507]AFY31858.1 sulfate ABC transporter, periplasmic sulfate-binding protein [Calothrix sp. PCC 7507]
MKYFPPEKLKFLKLANSEILGFVSQLFLPLKPTSTKTSALLMVAGVGLSLGIPNGAIANTSPTLQSQQKTLLISQKSNNVQLNLVSFSVTQAAYEKIIPQFVAKWKREKGQDVVFKQSYGASGSQAQAVINGLEADVVGLSLALDVKTIQDAGLIEAGWDRELPNGSIVTRSVVALETRPGNPKNIQTWADLAKPGIKVITPHPKTSGLGRWNFLTLWGTVTQIGGSENKAREYVSQVYKNSPILPKSAREATETFFKKGQGDVLINYENEVIWAKQTGQGASSYVIPKLNLSIDNPVAIVDKNVNKHGTREVAEAFAEFLFTPEAQREFTKVGFRPVDQTVAREVEKQFPKVDRLFSVVDLGGWNRVQKKFFDNKAIFDQIQSSKR